jgi:hypothetical protein
MRYFTDAGLIRGMGGLHARATRVSGEVSVGESEEDAAQAARAL